MSKPELEHNIWDAGAVVVILGTFAGYLPAVAAGLACVWYIVQIISHFRHGPKK